jgi:hypothetical protein
MLFQRQSSPDSYRDWLLFAATKSDRKTSISHRETTSISNFHPFNSTPQLSFLKISFKPPLTDYYFLNLSVKFKILA